MYQHWLPDSVQQKTLRDSGYYSVCLVYHQIKLKLFLAFFPDISERQIKGDFNQCQFLQQFQFLAIAQFQ